ncbi:hypothetical protein [Phenylobacterium sp.]|uniref:hypothetical protein n=1 Tax=Phenylobacterium sp. TaxID=1871053 RepID=UPI0039394508
MQDALSIRRATDELIAQARTMEPLKAARELRERARRAHRAMYRCKGDAFALAEARERLDAEADRLLATLH